MDKLKQGDMMMGEEEEDTRRAVGGMMMVDREMNVRNREGKL